MSASQIPDQGRNKNMTWQPKEKKSFSRDITVVFQVYFFFQLIMFMKITVLMQVRWLQYDIKNFLHIPFDSFIPTTNWCYGAHKLSCSRMLLVGYVTICYLLQE